MAKSAQERLLNSKPSRVVNPIPPGFPGATSADSMVVSSPLEVDGLIRTIPPGRLTTTTELRACLARRHDADIACPVSTGIFVNVVARAAEEAKAGGAPAPTPYWRVLKTGGFLNEKTPGGVEAHKRLLEAEGHTVARERRRWVVVNYAEVLFEPEP